jgi:glutamyl-tRNA reductase
MTLSVVAVTHRTAPVTIRERLSLPVEQQCQWLQRWGNQVPEIVLLVTCHRTEVYWLDGEETAHRGVEWLAELGGLTVEELERWVLQRSGAEAVRHAFCVAAGLDSRVVGEPQILGQVRRARDLARAAGTLGPILDRLFSCSLATGRMVRVRAGWSTGKRSLARVAVREAARLCSDLQSARVLVLGAGETGRDVIAALCRCQPAVVWWTNRSPGRLAQIPSEEPVRIVDWSEWPRLVTEADVVFVATNAPEPIVRLEHVTRHARLPRLLVDLAVPRNVDPAISDVPGIRVVTIDDLPADPVPVAAWDGVAVEPYVERAVRRYLRWLEARSIAAEIRAAHETLQSMLERELEKVLRLALRDPARTGEVKRVAAASMARKTLFPLFRALESEPQRVALALRLLAYDR